MRVLLIALLVAPAFAQDIDFTDIEEPAPRPSASAAPPPPVARPVAKPSPPAGVARDLIERYGRERQDAITERTYSLWVCDHDLRLNQAHIHDGDEWLARGDALWGLAQRTGERGGMTLALRHLHAAHEAYLASRVTPPKKYTWQDSPKPKPFPSAYPSDPRPGPGMGTPLPEPQEQWRRHDEYPFEQPSKFEEDPHY